MRLKTTKNEEKKAVEEERRCVNCGRGIKTLFVQYSPGNIRLMKCDNCKAVADPYIECEFMIILIDLILHKTKAYRHLLYNMLNLDADDTKGVFLKSSFVYFLLDACRISLISNSRDDWDSSGSPLVSIWTCGKVLMDVLLGNFVFISVIVLGTKFLLDLSLDITRCKEIMLAILISSYFKLFLIAMMVWEFPSSVLFIIDVFVLSSNAVALRVVTQLQTAGCLAVCFGAHAAKLFTDRWVLHLLSGVTMRKMLLT
ncbi:protein ARV 2 isoform X1 [Elaeis guineensis]|uniref:Protein ARV n=1 Tax=Elaeis guineensis var. tenera TaxID=51953 RepID=A0A6I9Q853_ELAGV|nr:protein arv1 homolog isoform X1 [Elaeis guineensis]